MVCPIYTGTHLQCQSVVNVKQSVAGTTAFATVIAAVAAGTTRTVAVTARTLGATLATRCARTTLGLYPAFRLGLKGAHRQAVFAGLGVDLKQLDREFVSLLDAAGLHVGQAVP